MREPFFSGVASAITGETDPASQLDAGVTDCVADVILPDRLGRAVKIGPDYGQKMTYKPRKARERKVSAPLDQARLAELALGYVARFATSRSKLAAYCKRKIAERGWESGVTADGLAHIDAVVARLAELGYINDEAFAAQKSASLGRRGYGARRVGEALMAAGIDQPDRTGAMDAAHARRWTAALALAKRRKLGPYGAAINDPALDDPALDDPVTRQRQLATMLRAGHDMDIARKIIASRDLQALEAEAHDEEDNLS